MSGAQLALAAAVLGGLFALPVARVRMSRPPVWSVRTNVNGLGVAAVLGDALAAGGVLAVAGLTAARGLGWQDAPSLRVLGALALVLAVMYVAGHADDRRGDESARGFGGHLGALRAGRVTGGLVKILAGGIAGVGAGLLLHSGTRVVATALLVALGANFVNLLDRAPGRAAKFAVLVGVPLALAAPATWGLSAAGLGGALAVVLPFDLAERGMLGDAGANPLGGAVGLGAALALTEVGAWVAVALLAAATLASERWSFSAGIERIALLRVVDRAGRNRSRGKEAASK